MSYWGSLYGQTFNRSAQRAGFGGSLLVRRTQTSHNFSLFSLWIAASLLPQVTTISFEDWMRGLFLPFLSVDSIDFDFVTLSFAPAAGAVAMNYDGICVVNTNRRL